VRAALLALATTGCTLGAGSAYVGEWRPRTVVDYRVCVEDALGRCASTRDVVTEHAPRRFWGVIFNMFSPRPSLPTHHPTGGPGGEAVAAAAGVREGHADRPVSSPRGPLE